MFVRLKLLGRTFKREIKVYQLVILDARTPRISRVFLSAAIGYALLPFDFIPDFIPVLGYLDDVAIVPGLVWLALRFVPKGVLNSCREQVVNSSTGLAHRPYS